MLSASYLLLCRLEAPGKKTRVTLGGSRPLSRRVCLAAIKAQGSSPRPNEYIGSDGRRKATIEEAFFPDTQSPLKAAGSVGRQPPWGISWQTSEQSVEWNDDIKQRLLTVCFGESKLAT